ncbi:MAG: hypothetical protein WC028_18275 [Candidatus Obscuribacterales bacterium]
MPIAFRTGKEPDDYRCPNCAEVIQKDAIMCRFCNSGLSPDFFYPCPACAEMVRNQATRCKTCNESLTPRPECKTLTVLAGGGNPKHRFTKNDALVRARVEECKQALKVELARVWRENDNEDCAHPDLAEPLFWAKLDPSEHEILRAMARQVVNLDAAPLTLIERGMVLQQLLDGILGFGPLGPLLRDPSVDRILVKAPNMVFATRDGQRFVTDVIFASKEDLDECIAIIIHRFTQVTSQELLARASSDGLLARGLDIYTDANGWLVPEFVSEALQEETTAFKGMPLVIVAKPWRQ